LGGDKKLLAAIKNGSILPNPVRTLKVKKAGGPTTLMLPTKLKKSKPFDCPTTLPTTLKVKKSRAVFSPEFCYFKNLAK
jgi:hypothetical protein